jgi:hypothetical protein
MRKTKKYIAAFLLVLACTLVTPAMAGPQNGEVNHVLSQPKPCSAELPDSIWTEIHTSILDLILEWVVVHDWFPQWGAGGE